MKIGKLVIEFHVPVTFSIEYNYMREVKQFLREGKKLHAVKAYKDATNTSLREAKDYVFDVLVPKYYKEPQPELSGGVPQYREIDKRGMPIGEWKDCSEGMGTYETLTTYDTPVGIFRFSDRKKTFGEKMKNFWTWFKNN